MNMKKIIIFTALFFVSLFFPACEKDDDNPAFTVTFDANGGSPAIVQVQVPLNERVTLPAYPLREGYDMVGWYWQADPTRLFDYEYARINADISLVAKWEPGTGQRYTVTFFARGGLPAPLPQSVVANTLARVPLNPGWPDPDPNVKNTFKGWYTDSVSFTTSFDLKKQKITGNIQLFAKWDSDIKTE